MYDPITVFLIVLGVFSVGLFLLLCFLPREVPLAFVIKLVLWCSILLTFAWLEAFDFSIKRRLLLGRVFLVIVFFPFTTLNAQCHSLLACRVSVEKSADSLMGVTLHVVIFPLLLLIFYLSL